MAELQTFRSAFNGFNREDVVRYIEYLNTRHNDQLAQALNKTVEGQPGTNASMSAACRQAAAEGVAGFADLPGRADE